MRVIVIGNGIAGVNVASGLSGTPGLEVEILSAETRPFYSRVRLPEVLSGASAPEAITFYKQEWYEKKGIAVRLGTRVESIDPSRRRVAIAGGAEEPYDALVLATGAVPNRPSVPGAELSSVHAMRTLDDVGAIRASLARDPSSASVVGGGLLGLEAARALAEAGARSVRVFEVAPRLLPRQLDEACAAILAARFRAMGIETVCAAELAAFVPSESDPARAGSLALKDGRAFPSATTILSMGVRPEISLAHAAGISCNRGIVVDDRMRSSASGVYAVGDCAEFGGVVWGIIPAALEQAPVAARAILADLGLSGGAEAPRYAQTVPKTALKVAGIELLSVGKAVPSVEELSSGAVVERVRAGSDGARYEKLVLERAEGGYRLAGAILFGSKARQAWAQKAMGSPMTPDEADAILASE
jgi:nitrite reductase (NADH) large subunit